MPEIQQALTQRRETAIVVEETESILKKRSVRLKAFCKKAAPEA
ncbi:hypothetical protein [Paenibacillus amylolyticus]|nr:hypothetical protein [Paenibacillus amylolyticus]